MTANSPAQRFIVANNFVINVRLDQVSEHLPLSIRRRRLHCRYLRERRRQVLSTGVVTLTAGLADD
jgi:hypothetical protein